MFCPQTRRPKRTNPIERLRRIFLLASLVGLLSIVSVRIVAAQSAEEISGARALAEQGIEAFGDKKFHEAYDLMNRAKSLYHAQIHLLFIARSAEKPGKLVEARESYNKLVPKVGTSCRVLVPIRQKVVPRANREAIAGFIRPPLQPGLVKPGTDFRHEVLVREPIAPDAPAAFRDAQAQRWN